MKNIFILSLNTIKVLLKKKTNRVIYIILPVVVTLAATIIYSSVGNGTSDLNIGVTNKDSGSISQEFIEAVEENRRYKITEVEESEINSFIASRKVDCLIYIPENFSQNIYNGEGEGVKIVSIRGEDVTAWIKSYSNFYINNLVQIGEVAAGDKEIFNKIYEGYRQGELKLVPKELEDQSISKAITFQSVGLLLMFILIGAGITSDIIIKEKRQRTYFRIFTAPVNSRIYIGGNILASFIIVLVQICLTILFLKVIFKVNLFVNPFILIFILACFGIVAISLSIAIVSFAKSSVQAGNLTNMIVIPTCMLGGCFWPIDIMPNTAKKIANFMPQKWVMEAVAKLQNGYTLKDVSLNIIIILSFALALFLIAMLRIKNNNNVGNFVK